MEQMRERVARAICKAGAIDPDELNDDTGRPMWRYFMPEADAAISLMQPEIDCRVAENTAWMKSRIDALERCIYSYVDTCNVRQDDEAFLLEIVRRLSNQLGVGQPWLRTYDAHLKENSHD